ncbi:hypothetical protein [Glycomyces sp. NRRL B-16210]|uniref:hypothetical protein n=1 Tax=Glycomyces sp. NRRL B-16210 TaxID=1463821 RepID=UPI00105D16D7|nr:hypothetical protein [Glycomyces sp. NRRL B-16210]
MANTPYERIARERIFKAGQKFSTFPWVNTATALFEHAGRCWLASEIAIIGAAAPLNLGYSKRPGASAFGQTSHPSELVAQTREHSKNTEWWQEELATVKDELGRAEWALALWSVADGVVISNLLSLWSDVIGELPEARRRTVLRAAEQIAQSGWLSARPVTGETNDAELAALIEIRAPDVRSTRPRTRTPQDVASVVTAHVPKSLLSVARSHRWLKVDSMATYR